MAMSVPDARFSEVLVLSYQHGLPSLQLKCKVHSRLEVFTMCLSEGVLVDPEFVAARGDDFGSGGFACWPSRQSSASSAPLYVQ